VDGAGHGRRWRPDGRLAYAAGAKRAHPLPGLQHDRLDIREVGGARDQILEEPAGEVDAFVKDDLLEQRHAEALGGSAADLPLHRARVDGPSHVVRGNVPEQLDLPGVKVDFGVAQVGAECEIGEHPVGAQVPHDRLAFGYQDQVASLARETGALWIADETVTGFGRVGGWLQFQRGQSRPDLVTLGKCMSAGGAAAGAVVLSKDLLERLDGTSWQSYSTYRSHPVAMAAIRAHLRVSSRERLYERARDLDGHMLRRLAEVAAQHPSVARADGRGLHWTVELNGPDWHEWRGEEASPLASRVVARALKAGALIATSGEQTSLFLAPPLVVCERELDLIFDALHHGLELADKELAAGA
jgi:hypothetical protein